MQKSPQQILKKTFGYDNFRPQQEEIISHILKKKDALILMPTGGGKSICYQIPALLFEGITVVVSPLISLMKDQVQALQTNGIAAEYVNSSLSSSEEEKTWKKALNKELKLLYLSPEKLITISNSWLQQLPVSLIAIDEAHCISMWGHDFRPEYTQIKNIRQQFPSIPFIGLTATADKITRTDIINQLGLIKAKTFLSSFNRKNLSLFVYSQIPKKKKIQQITSFILERKNESGIIYCLSRKNTEELVFDLKQAGINAAFYHAGMNAQNRDSIQEKFINDELKIIVATIAFGMGIDKSNVRWVIHSNLPKNIEGYYQEIGRAGRDGIPSDTLLFFNYRDVVLLQQFANQSGQASIQQEKLKRMQQFAEATSCRRKILLAYFSEHLNEDCGNCDICLNPPSFFDGTIIAQKALSAIARLNEDVSINMLINVLRGSRNAELVAQQYYKIKTYGKGAEYSFFDWQNYLIQLVNIGTIEIAYQDKNKLKLTPFGWEILKREKKINLTKPIAFEKRKTKKEQKTIQNNNSPLFEKLRELRQKIALQEKVPAYIIFNDNSLKQMASEMPVTNQDFLAISGVGEQKQKNYGTQFMEIIKDFKISNKPNIKSNTYEITYELYQQELSIEEIAKKRDLTVNTIFSHLCKLVEMGKPIDLNKHINPQEKEKIKAVIKTMDEITALKPIYEALNQEIPYHTIQAVLTLFNQNNNAHNSL